MAKMRISRKSLSKAALEAFYRGAKQLELSGEILELAAARERPALGRGEIGERFADATRGIQLPAGKGAQPAARAIGRLDEVPDLLEAHRFGAGRLAHPAAEAHARPVLVLLGGELEEIGVERDDIGVLARGLHVAAQLVVHLARGELANL